ncbi:hypothetical protein NOF55_16240 [Rhizobiaceae bacterium BDR2-2]|uniref:Lipoprotein n=1 Tax=Ectorhizobium quercum TaxID=2965071 RepID=A0AAE3MXU8_9HYPH|nr:hypothetical protein [Ectorhizobium quercum]MCX8996297.1 hypothetical protein [Ectorhizobium quercum]MCX8998664.1 hypothetical protein [Ectorhizobium quercum]
MSKTHMYRVSAYAAGIASACLALGSCASGPTYGTDKTATEQLFSDLGSVVAVSRKSDGPAPKYTPRPGLVTPAQGSAPNLVAPQTALNDRTNNPDWVESPEETRRRLVAEADANADNPNYRSPLLAGRGQAGTLTEEQRWQAFRKAKADASPAAGLERRRYLSDPPPTYRQPAETASIDDLGVPETQKEKRRLKEAQSGEKSTSWWNPFR